ncbi:hypothetical protein N499_0554A, partial [Wolbachia pipientis wVitA]
MLSESFRQKSLDK